MAASIYLDHSTAAKPSDACLSKMVRSLKESWGTSAVPHQLGNQLLHEAEEALRELYHLLGVQTDEDLIITSSGAEAVNHVIQSVYYDVTRTTGKNHFVAGSIDEASAILAMNRLDPLGCASRLAQANKQGIITAEAIAEAITPRTALVSLSWANGLTGVIQPIGEIAALCKKRGILFHLDATHVIGKLFFDVQEVGADFVTFNGSQLHAPQGIGALYVHKGQKISPFIVGGNEQAGLRAGAISIPLLAGFGVAAKEAREGVDYLCTEVARLRNQFEIALGAGVVVLFKEQERLPHCTTVAFPGICHEALLFALDSRGVCASMGGGHFQQIALNLTACGIDDRLAQCALSFSLGRTTTEEEIDRAALIILEETKRLRALSSHIIEVT